MAPKFRISEIDGLRAIAVLIVVIWHTALRIERFSNNDTSWLAYTPHGETGVVLFFVISGYVAAVSLLRTQKVSWSDFYLRRFLRIAPLYYVILIGMFIATQVLGIQPDNAPSYDGSAAGAQASLAYSMVFVHGIVFGAPPKLLPPGWSLEIEAEFYILAPVLLLLWQVWMRRGRPWPATLAAVVACWLGTIVLVDLMASFRWTLLAYLPFFLLGIGLYQFLSPAEPDHARRSATGLVTFLLGLLMLILGSYIRNFGTDSFQGVGILPDSLRLLIMLLGALLMFRSSLSDERVGSFLNSRVLQLIGAASFSIYLTHVPVLHISAMLYTGVFGHPQSLSGNMALAAFMVSAGALAGILFYKILEINYNSWAASIARRHRSTAL